MTVSCNNLVDTSILTKGLRFRIAFADVALNQSSLVSVFQKINMTAGNNNGINTTTPTTSLKYNITSFDAKSDDIFLSAKACPAGYYCTKAGGTTPCPAGTFNSFQGATNLSDCKSCALFAPLKECLAGTATPATCAPGTYFDSVTTMRCIVCPAGKFCNTEQSDTPQSCPIGTFSASSSTGLKSVAECTRCSLGFFCATAGSTAPSPCAAGTYGAVLGQTKSGDCVTCPIGFFCPLGTGNPYPCAQSTYGTKAGAVSQADGCASCPVGRFCAEGSTSSGISYADCPSGFYCPSSGSTGGSPIACPAGKYNAFQGMTQLSDCLPCPAPLVCPLATFKPTACPAGTVVSADAKECLVCPAGKYCPSGVPDAILCPGGTFLDAVGGSGLSSCKPCPGGKYCLDEGGGAVISPASCPAGTYSDAGAKNVEECLACPAGSYCTEGTKTPKKCPSGTYLGEEGVGVALSSCIACTGDQSCVEGSVAPQAKKDCPVGYYCPPTTGTPLPCPANTFSTTVGLISYFQCEKCPSNKLSAPGSTACETCPDGFYGLNGACAACPPGMHCAEGASPVACPVGTFRSTGGGGRCNPCPKGHYCPNTKTTAPTPCAKGTFNSNLSENRTTACKTCLEGAYCGATGTGDPPACPQGFFCPSATITPRMCSRGGYGWITGGGSSSAACKICPPGYYCPNNGMSAPTPTPAGYYQPMEGAVSLVSAVACNVATHICKLGSSAPQAKGTCPKGYYCPSTSVEPILCPAHTYNAMENRTNLAECLACPTNRVCQSAGTITPAKCEAGKAPKYVSGAGSCELCPAGSYCNQDTSDTAVSCPQGTYLATSGGKSSTDCQMCPRGSYCPAGSTQPVNCPAGTYNEAIGKWASTSCSVCPAGSLCPQGSVTPTKCAKGTYLSTQNQNNTACLPCPAGKYCSEGTTQPSACAPGTFRSLFGGDTENSCQACPSGRFCPLLIDNPGIANPLSCPTQTWSSPGSGSKLQCRCLASFKCTYTQKLVIKTVIQGSLLMFLNNTNGARDALMAAVAKAAGVNVSKVNLTTITSGNGTKTQVVTSPPLRRLLATAKRHFSSSSSSISKTTSTTTSSSSLLLPTTESEAPSKDSFVFTVEIHVQDAEKLIPKAQEHGLRRALFNKGMKVELLAWQDMHKVVPRIS